MTARATDWGLALLVGLLFATGVMTLFAGQRGDAWVFAAHGAGGFALAGVVGWKLRRVWRRLARPARWDRRTAAGAAALTLVVATLLSGVGWSSGLQLSAGGYNLLGWHFALGAVLTFAVAVHALLRAKPLRRRDLAGRRQFLRTGALVAGSYLAWELQRPLSAWVGLRGARRRFTGSYEADSFAGNAFPSTSWVADSPRPPSEAGRRMDNGDRAYEPQGAATAPSPHHTTLASFSASAGALCCPLGRGAGRGTAPLTAKTSLTFTRNLAGKNLCKRSQGGERCPYTCGLRQ